MKVRIHAEVSFHVEVGSGGLSPENRVVECGGYLVYLRPDSVPDEIYWSLVLDTYEAEEAELVREYLPSDTDVIELGAGLGYVSCVIEDELDGDRRQVAVEPNPNVVPWLRRTKVLNDAGFAVREAAYGSESETVRLDVGEAFWTATTSRDDGIEVPAVTLLSLREEAGLSTFSLVMDIEGGEYEVLTAEMDLLEACCPVIIVEFHDEGPYASAYADELEESAFELVDGIESVCVYRNSRSVD